MNKKLLTVTLILALTGFILCLLLAQVSMGVATDPGYESFCNLSESYNCEAVAGSKYAVHFGIPNFIYGLCFYLIIIVFSCYCYFNKNCNMPNFFVYLFWLSFVSVIISVYLFSLSVLFIKSKCILCLMIYGVNCGLFIVAFMAEKWSVRDLFSKLFAELKATLDSPVNICAVFVLAVIGFGVLFYFRSNPLLTYTNADTEVIEFVDVEYAESSPDRLVSGARKLPAITIVEFTDFECPFCAKASFALKKVLKNNPDVRLIFKDYPLDNSCNKRISRPFHQHACLASLYSKCSAEQGKFWEYHDLLFENQKRLDRESLLSYAKQINLNMNQFEHCIESQRHMAKILTNIDEAAALGVQGTPTFFIEGLRITGSKTADEFQTIIDQIREKMNEASKRLREKKSE